MNRIIVLLAVLGCRRPVTVLPAGAADGPVKTYSQDVTLGFFRGEVGLVPRPRAGEARGGNKVAPIWTFTNGHGNQRNVIDTVPGRTDYAPLWAVRMVTWRTGVTAQVLQVRRRDARGPARRPGDDRERADRRELSGLVEGLGGRATTPSARRPRGRRARAADRLVVE